MHLQLVPLHPDPRNIGDENGVGLWTASTIDPAFVARLAEGSVPMEAGWYRASVVLDARRGEVCGPRLYLPDPRGAFSEVLSVELTREGGAYTAEFFLPHPVDHLRFDPSTEPCEFACSGLEVSPIAEPAPRAPAQTNVPHSSRPPDRKARVLAGIDRNGFGVEIGPSLDPLAPKSEGFKVHVIDHASREELLAKYAPHNMPLDRIEEVDFVWRGQTYLELTGRPKFYDWIIASHLIEHTPDLIAFLTDCDSILKDTGVLSLVIPDKRYEFDRFRPITGLARIVDAHIAGHKIHTAGAAAEYFMNVVTKGGLHSWDAGTPGEYDFIHSAQLARDMIREVNENGAYLDVHNWCFVPHSFRLLMADLYALGYIKLREVDFHPVEGHEFYMTLGRDGAGPPLSRLEMLQAIDSELAVPDPQRE